MSHANQDLDIIWDSPVPLKGPAWAELTRAKLGQTIELMVLSSRPIATLTHFVRELGTKGRTFPCIKTNGKCPYCQAELRQVWKAYLGCWNPYKRCKTVAEITPEAYRGNDLLMRPDYDLRGKRMKMYRLGNKENGKVSVVFDEFNGKVKVMEPFDVRRALLLTWGLLLSQQTVESWVSAGQPALPQV